MFTTEDVLIDITRKDKKKWVDKHHELAKTLICEWFPTTPGTKGHLLISTCQMTHSRGQLIHTTWLPKPTRSLFTLTSLVSGITFSWSSPVIVSTCALLFTRQVSGGPDDTSRSLLPAAARGDLCLLLPRFTNEVVSWWTKMFKGLQFSLGWELYRCINYCLETHNLGVGHQVLINYSLIGENTTKYLLKFL